MTQNARLAISAAAASFVRGGASKDEKMNAARGQVDFSPTDLAVVLVLLSRDGDPEVRGAALATLGSLSDEQLRVVTACPEMHPKVLDLLARIHWTRQEVASSIAAHPHVEAQTLEYLTAKGTIAGDAAASAPEPVDAFVGEDEVEDPDGPDEEDFRSKYQLAQVISISEKIKFALTGDKEWRSIMIKDSNKLVSGAVLKNPRITEQEILGIAKSNMINEETVRIICNNKDWIKNYQIRKALVENNKTPLPFALRFLSTLSEKDLGLISKSKNVSTVIATQARKSLALLQKRR